MAMDVIVAKTKSCCHGHNHRCKSDERVVIEVALTELFNLHKALQQRINQ